MNQSVRSSLTFTYRVLDLIALSLAFVMAAALTSPGSVPSVCRALWARELHVFVSLTILLLSWSVCLSSLWLYRSKRLASGRDELLEVIKAVSLCTLLLSAAELLLEWQTVHKELLLSFWLLAASLLFLVRVLKRSVLRQFRLHGRNLRRVVIVGTGDRAQQLAALIRKHAELGYRLLGFIDNRQQPGVIGSLAHLADILRDNVVDEIMIALPFKTCYEEMETIVQTAAEQGVMVRVHSDLFSVRLTRAVAEQLDETPLLSFYAGAASRWRVACKQVMDFLGAAALLLLFAPLLLLLALIIKLTSPGPVFCAQKQLGYNKRPFRLFRFRTMAAPSSRRQAGLASHNEAQGAVSKFDAEPRLTPLGRWLCKTSLDELPQLFNVLKGDLSLVGPRPLPRHEYDRFSAYSFNRRFSVKPGITCLRQVSGRGATTVEQWIKQDLAYIDNWSLALDLEILLKTIPVVLRGTGTL
jgi:exopolysaccharide biosynthesis polyprenyl glycosylphosphotransferase